MDLELKSQIMLFKFKLRCLTRGVSNVGDAMTSSQQNPHGGGPNGG